MSLRSAEVRGPVGGGLAEADQRGGGRHVRGCLSWARSDLGGEVVRGQGAGHGPWSGDHVRGNEVVREPDPVFDAVEPQKA